MYALTFVHGWWWWWCVASICVRAFVLLLLQRRPLLCVRTLPVGPSLSPTRLWCRHWMLATCASSALCSASLWHSTTSTREYATQHSTAQHNQVLVWVLAEGGAQGGTNSCGQERTEERESGTIPHLSNTHKRHPAHTFL